MLIIRLIFQKIAETSGIQALAIFIFTIITVNLCKHRIASIRIYKTILKDTTGIYAF